jgi:hypothetical protein
MTEQSFCMNESVPDDHEGYIDQGLTQWIQSEYIRDITFAV